MQHAEGEFIFGITAHALLAARKDGKITIIAHSDKYKTTPWQRVKLYYYY